MPANLDLHPDTGHPALECVREVHEALDRAGRIDAAVPSGEYATLLTQCQRAISRLEGLKLHLIAEADRARVASLSGMSGTDAWAAKQTRTGGRDSAKAVRLAGALAKGHEATRTALGEGELTAEHAQVIVAATRSLPGDLGPTQVAEVERSLVDKARTTDPGTLRRAARRALAAVESDQARVDSHEDGLLRDEEAAARAKTRLSIRDNGDGTLTGWFTVPTLAGAILNKTIQQIASPRRGRRGATHAQAGDARVAGPEAGADWARRYGEAFVELLEHLPTDQLHGKVAATVVVTLDHDKLMAAIGVAGLDTGDQLSAAETRRIACGAGLLPAVLGGVSQPLDLGRSQRFFTEAQRVAGATRHTTCAADGCERPYSWCELHHRTAWGGDGPTDLANLVPVCGFHHRRIHDPGYRHRERPDGTISFHRRT